MKDGASTSSARTELKVSSETLSLIQSAARTAHPREACGILTGTGARITGLIITPNVHPTPETHFEIHHQSLIDAHRAEREGGPQVVGYFHSHPTTTARPSATDRASAAHDGKIWAIHGTDGIAFWRDDEAGFTPLSYSLLDA